MAKEVTAWRWKRRAREDELRRQKVPQSPADLMFTVRHEQRTFLGPESVAGEEWLVANADPSRRVARSFVVDTRELPAIVERAETAGLCVRERQRTTT